MKVNIFSLSRGIPVKVNEMKLEKLVSDMKVPLSYAKNQILFWDKLRIDANTWAEKVNKKDKI